MAIYIAVYIAICIEKSGYNVGWFHLSLKVTKLSRRVEEDQETHVYLTRIICLYCQIITDSFVFNPQAPHNQNMDIVSLDIFTAC